MASAIVDAGYRLSDRFDRREGRVYLTGWDALLRLPLMQRERDAAAGLDTAGFVSGYPGSPFGGLDSLFRSQREMLAGRGIHFEPGINEDLAATSIWGSQMLDNGPVASRHDGVFGMWYGKGPGVERSTDAMRTASYQGVATHGGVLALAGDDHDARSTVTAQQSDLLFVHMHMPVLNPATVQEFIDFGLAGWALSRFASVWVGMICLNDTTDSGATVDIDPLRPALVRPDHPTPPPLGTPRAGGVGGAAQLEHEIRTMRVPAAQAFMRANGLDKVTLESAQTGESGRGLGIVASGKAYLDLIDGLGQLGLDLDRARQLGVSIYKPAMTWPLEPTRALRFVDGLDEVLIVEPKYPLIEDQVNRLLRQIPLGRRPGIVGKTDETGQPLIPEHGALNASIVAEALLRRLEGTLDADVVAGLRPRQSLGVISLRATASGESDAAIAESAHEGESSAKSELVRAAGFCSGCPHNTSTMVPEGSFGIGGTGCHGMAIGLGAPERDTYMWTHMGGEGALWIGMAPFTDQRHTFQNMGDGTYSHSGYMALRAAIAADVTMTFKILLNGYISMTGGQSIPGALTAAEIAAQVLAEGAKKVAVVTDNTAKYKTMAAFPADVSVHDRAELMDVHEQLRAVDGVTVLVYDQACAAELRRERKRGNAVDPDKRVFIDETVCEGCGDCNVQSNCISVEPHDTELGRKRRINQSSCNKDFSCLNGYCPSFVTLYGATPRRQGSGRAATDPTRLWDRLDEPATAASDEPCNIVVTGIGGGGVLTVGAILGMAAHLEGKSATVLNESGLAQKNGAVQSHIRVTSDLDIMLSPRISARAADLIIGADIVVAAGGNAVSAMDPGRTVAIVNDDVRPTVQFVNNKNVDMSAKPFIRVLNRATGNKLELVDAHRLAAALMGDAIYMNSFLMGYALQRGLLPVSLAALQKAIELNGVAVADNFEALNWGRLAAHDLELVEAQSRLGVSTEGAATDVALTELDDIIEHRSELLARYQDRPYADRYVAAVRRVASAEAEQAGGRDEVACAAARYLYKLMAYKDEYEVARLYADPAFRKRIESQFEGDYRMEINLAPQILNRRDTRTGRAKKWAVPVSVAIPIFRAMAHGRRLRGTAFDPFGRSAHRRAERTRIDEYEELLEEIAIHVTVENHELAVQLASLPDDIRGYDTVKDESARAVAEKQATLIEQFRSFRA